MMNEIRCLERSINPNIANFRDSELRIGISLQQYSLSLGVTTLRDRSPMALASYRFLPSDRTYRDNIQALIRQEKLLDPSFQYANRNFTVQEFKSSLIPEKLYEPPYGKKYLEALFHLNGKECVTQETESNSKSFILSAFNGNYLKAAQLIYARESNRMGFTSIYAHLTCEAYRVARTFKRFPFHVILHTRQNEFDLVVVNDNGLLFINTFPYPDFDNLLYYFLYALNKLKLDMGSVALYLCGSASKDKLLPLLERQVYAITYLPAPSPLHFPTEMPYDRYFHCL